MSEVKVPKRIEKKLMNGEKVIANCGIFYATNKHLIRYSSKFNFRILSYDNISITYEKIWTHAIYPISLIILAFITLYFMNIAIQISEFPDDIVISCLPWLSFICFISVSIIMAIPSYHYQIRSPDIYEDALKKWLIPKGKKTDIFIEIIKNQFGVSIEK